MQLKKQLVDEYKEKVARLQKDLQVEKEKYTKAVGSIETDYKERAGGIQEELDRELFILTAIQK